MKKKLFLSIAVFFGFFAMASAQTFNKDSMSLARKIFSDKEKLLKKQSSVTEYENKKSDAARQAQESADENREAAMKLSENPQDKKLARKADSKAGDAKSDARRARVAAQDLDDLHKDIKELTEKIAKEQQKMDKMIIAAPLATPVVKAEADKTRVAVDTTKTLADTTKMPVDTTRTNR